VNFDDADLAKTYQSERELRKKYGVERTKKIQRRIKALQAAETLADMEGLPGRCHELRGNLARHLSLDLDGPYRLLFRPTSEPEPGRGGGLDWSTVRAVTVIAIVDTHD
jgi:plasmid maintenance system killer protein